MVGLRNIILCATKADIYLQCVMFSLDLLFTIVLPIVSVFLGKGYKCFPVSSILVVSGESKEIFGKQYSIGK